MCASSERSETKYLVLKLQSLTKRANYFALAPPHISHVFNFIRQR